MQDVLQLAEPLRPQLGVRIDRHPLRAELLRDFNGSEPLANYDPNASAFPVSSLSYANERSTYRQIGGELGARFYPVQGLDVYANYSIHETSAADEDKVDSARAREQQTSLHKGEGGIQHRSWFGLEASTDLSWCSEQLWIEQVTDVEARGSARERRVERGGVRWQPYGQPAFLMVSARVGYRLLGGRLELGVAATNLAAHGRRQHPLGQPIDTRVLGTAKVRF